ATARATREVRAAGAPQITPAEKVVIRAVSSIEANELRHMAAEMLHRERLHIGLETETLLSALLEHMGAVEDLMSLPLEEADRRLLATLLMEEDEPLTTDLLEGAFFTLRRRQLAHREREIKRGIVEAERSNDIPALLRLKQEKLELDRKLAGE